jgi:phosphatidate cytidylyltransferase
MKTRILTAILIILAVLFPVALGGWLLTALGIFIVVTGSYEWLHAMKGYSNWGPVVLVLLAGWLVGLYWIPGDWMLAYWGIGLVVFWSLPIFVPSFSEGSCLSTLAFMLIMGTCFLCMKLLITTNYHYLWTLCFATYGSDTGAYFAGRFLGKHKMIERVSPKKTWEGFFGGWFAGFLLSFGLSFLYRTGLNPVLNIMICILAPVFAELGDLNFSSYKRFRKTKDFSNLLPGHGGVLDRVDSLLMNFLLFGILYHIF